MPAESERPIEKQLRDYAASRRDAAGKDAFALHPVTRNALQVEVEREFGRQGRTGGTRPGWLMGWWPRLALGGGALAAVSLLAIVLIPRQEQRDVGDLAKVEDSDKPVTVDASLLDKAASAPELAGNFSNARRRQEFRFSNSRTQGNAVPAATPVPEPVAAPPTQPTRLAAGDATRSEVRATPRQPAASPALASRPVATAGNALLQGSFQVVLLDDQISLVDVDQSEYSGRLEPMDPVAAGATVPNRALSFEERYYQFVQDGVLQQVPVAAQFVLTGTNRSTRLPVQIVGQMVTRTQAVPTQVTGGTTAKQAAGTPGVYLQINATATASDGEAIQIDASAQPQ